MLEVVEVELVPGLVVAGRWRLEHAIGRGGFGVVWAAVDVTTGEPCALKCLTEEGASDAKRQERLRREARAMSAISHPNIARVFSVEELPAGTPFIVMELLRGPSLHARLARGPLSPSQARGLLIQIADALRTVHAQGIIHRDLKPANVIIVEEHTVKVLDFGIAKNLSAVDRKKLTTTGTALGTLNYMAPEQIFGERDVDGRCDIWALGILAHECMTLRRPTDADGDNAGQVLKNILDGNFPRLSSMVRDCPPDLDELVARMLVRSVADRPTSEEVFAVLSRPAAAVTVPRSYGKTNFMVETIQLADAPLFAKTVRDEAFASSQLVPSTVVPSTVMPSTVVPSTVMVAPTGDGRSVPAAATMHSAPHGMLSPPRAGAPAISPPRVSLPETRKPAFDRRGRGAKPRRPPVLAIALVAAGMLTAIALVVLLLANTRARRDEGAAGASRASPTATASPASQTGSPSTSQASASPSAASSVAVAAGANASTPPSANAAAGAPRRTGPASSSGRAGSGGRPAAGKDDPPISDERF